MSLGCDRLPGVRSGDGVQEQAGPPSDPGQVEHGAPPAVRQASGGGELPQLQAFGFPPAGAVPGQGEGLQPGGGFAGHGDQGAPDPVLVKVVQRYLKSSVI
jgi:hypothetical protein